MWEDSRYCWVVMCKNHWFHLRQNLFFGHRIPLGEADAYTPPPNLQDSFTVRCDECHKEYRYKPSEVMRFEQELPASFSPHPLFQSNFMSGTDQMPLQDAVETVVGPERRRSQRLLLDVGLVVRGESVAKEAFKEETFTISVSAHGALFALSAKVALGQTLFLVNPEPQSEVEGRVTRFGPPRGGLAQVGVEFAQPTPKFWPVESEPANWKAFAR